MPRSILIIDDSRIARIMLNSCILQYKEFDVFEADDGTTGIEKYKEINNNLSQWTNVIIQMQALKC